MIYNYPHLVSLIESQKRQRFYDRQIVDVLTAKNGVHRGRITAPNHTHLHLVYRADPHVPPATGQGLLETKGDKRKRHLTITPGQILAIKDVKTGESLYIRDHLNVVQEAQIDQFFDNDVVITPAETAPIYKVQNGPVLHSWKPYSEFRQRLQWELMQPVARRTKFEVRTMKHGVTRGIFERRSSGKGLHVNNMPIRPSTLVYALDLEGRSFAFKSPELFDWAYPSGVTVTPKLQLV